jgi:hypothetical protein
MISPRGDSPLAIRRDHRYIVEDIVVRAWGSVEHCEIEYISSPCSNFGGSIEGKRTENSTAAALGSTSKI